MLFRRFLADRRAGALTLFAVAAPVALGAVAIAVDYAAVHARRAELQAAADAGALAAGRELLLADASEIRVNNVAVSTAEANIAQDKIKGASLQVKSAILDKRSAVQVSITEHVESWFGSLLGNGMDIAVESTVRLFGEAKVCVVGLSGVDKETVNLNRGARLTAIGCSIFSNAAHPEGVKAADLSVLVADKICSAGGIVKDRQSNVQGIEIVDCPPLGDPLAGRAAPTATGCKAQGLELKGGTHVLEPGVYCGGLRVSEGAQVKLQPGIYVIDGDKLKVDGGGRLEGDYVGFFLKGPNATFEFGPNSTISLSAPKTGAMAGLLFFDDRTKKIDKHRINSNDARRLVGTIYLPKSTLYIDAKKPVSDLSAYTVIVAYRLELFDGPNLVLNSNYAASDVPVPKGLGPVSATTYHLTR